MVTNIEVHLDPSDIAALRSRTGIRDTARALAVWISVAKSSVPLVPVEVKAARRSAGKGRYRDFDTATDAVRWLRAS